jgi:streptomycin 6-kinase
VLVIADQPGLNAVAFEEGAGAARVLTEDDVSLAELAKDAKSDVLEVADRRRADDEWHYCSFR